MNLCIFHIETVPSLINGDYSPTRMGFITNAVAMIMNTHYFTDFSVVLQNESATVSVAPSKGSDLISVISSTKLVEGRPQPIQALLKSSLIISSLKSCDSVHIVSFITEETSVDTLPRQLRLQVLNSTLVHVHFVLMGDVLSPESHTHVLLKTLIKRQGHRWSITNASATDMNPFRRLLFRLSEGISISHYNRTSKPAFIVMKSGQIPSESKAGKFVSCKVVNRSTKDKVQMIPVPIITSQKILVTIRCGRCDLIGRQCLPQPGIGQLMLIELSPVLFKLVWRTEFEIEPITLFHREGTVRCTRRQDYQFIIVESAEDCEIPCRSVYWAESDAPVTDFCRIMTSALTQEVPQSYIKIMYNIWADNRKALSSLEELYLDMRRVREGVLEMTKAEEVPSEHKTGGN